MKSDCAITITPSEKFRTVLHFHIFIDTSTEISVNTLTNISKKVGQIMTKMMREAAYTTFKASLFDERLMPGQFLSLRELCDKLDVSMSPLRDALRLLEGEGLVELLPQRGVRITMVDRQFVQNAFQVRRFLEVGACREFANLEPWPELKDIHAKTKDLIARAENGVNDDLLKEAYEIDWQFHNELIAVMKNDVLSDIHRSNADKVRLIRLNSRFTSSRVLPAMQEHLLVIEALLEQRFDDAADAMSRHLQISESRALGHEKGLA